MKYASLALLFVFGAAFFGSTASAQLLDATGTVDVTGSATADDTTVDASANAKADLDTTATSSEASPAQDPGFTFAIDRDTLDTNTSYNVTDADQVRSAASLESYASATVLADERLERLTVEGGELNMEYRKPAKFLWVIPTSMKVTVTADAAGDVSVRYPWYAFLMQTDESRADLEARLAAEIGEINDSLAVAAAAELSGEARGSGVQGNPEIRRWARIIESAYVAVAGSARVDASAETAS